MNIAVIIVVRHLRLLDPLARQMKKLDARDVFPPTPEKTYPSAIQAQFQTHTLLEDPVIIAAEILVRVVGDIETILYNIYNWIDKWMNIKGNWY